MRVSTVPTPRVLLSVRNHKWTPAEALAELIDNSFGEARGNAQDVYVNVDRRTKVVEVYDNGRGCDDISDLFTLGKGTRERGENDIGLYGVGGSEALLWLADKVTVASLRGGQSSSTTVDWGKQLRREEFPEVDNGWRKATPGNTPEALLALGQGTYIRLKLHKGVRLPFDGDQRSALRKPIAKLFAAGLLTGRRIIWNDEPLEPFLPDIDHARDVSFHVVVETEDGKKLGAYVNAGPAAPGKVITVENSTLAVMFAYRTIEWTRDCYDGFTGAGLAGTIALGNEWREYITTTKDGFADENLRAALVEKVTEGLLPMLALLRDEQVDTLFAKVAMKLQMQLGGIFNVSPEGTQEELVAFPNGEGGGGGPGPKNFRELDPEGEPRKGDYAGTVIDIRGRTDAEMDGRLVVIDVKPDSILALVNKEHAHIEAALIKQPTNAMLLAALITQELARQLSATPDKLVTFKVYTRRRLDELQAGHEEPLDILPYVYRTLLDGVSA
jgi:hypothetical protein